MDLKSGLPLATDTFTDTVLSLLNASVVQLDNPDLIGKAVIVGGDPKQRGVVSTASYEARKFGVHSATPMSQAIRLCPKAIVLPVRMKRYAEL
jgi:DNA polymerase-4